MYELFIIEDDQTCSSVANSTNGKMNAFFAENYDHENVINNVIIHTETISSNESKPRKSVSAHFRSISKDSK